MTLLILQQNQYLTMISNYTKIPKGHSLTIVTDQKLNKHFNHKNID